MCRSIKYENGFIVLLSPSVYFANPHITAELKTKGLILGRNALVFYETREQWVTNNPNTLNWTAALTRSDPLGGQYVARISATTAEDGERIVRGFNATSMKGAGIRVYEYASATTTAECRSQLEALFWLCRDSENVAVNNGMTVGDAAIRKAAILEICEQRGLLDMHRLAEARSLNVRDNTVCPLCLEELSSQGFLTRMTQAEGRTVLDLTVTELNLFHVAELRYGVCNHKPYNLGWGHHHCNVVVRDSGIQATLGWMRAVLDRNIQEGHVKAANSVI